MLRRKKRTQQDDINLHISGKKHEILEKKQFTMSSKKLITGVVLTNYVSIIPKAISFS